MVEFSRKLWYKTVLHTPQKKYDRQWGRCLELRGTGQIGKMATEFLKKGGGGDYYGHSIAIEKDTP